MEFHRGKKSAPGLTGRAAGRLFKIIVKEKEQLDEMAIRVISFRSDGLPFRLSTTISWGMRNFDKFSNFFMKFINSLDKNNISMYTLEWNYNPADSSGNQKFVDGLLAINK